jgi:CRP-like cAMP-binding protein
MATVSNELDIFGELRQLAVFSEVGREALAEMALACAQRRVNAGASLVDQGIPSLALVIVVRGAAKTVRSLGGTGEEESVVLDVMRAPCIVADAAVIDGNAASASVVALRASHIITLERRALLRLMTTHPSLGRALLSRFAQEVRGTVRRMDEIMSGPVDERVTNLLDSLSLTHGTPLGQGRFIAIPLRRRDLANMVNATTETVSRLLAKFEREGLARSTRDGIWWRSPPPAATPAAPPASSKRPSGTTSAVSVPVQARQGSVG